MSNNTSDRIDRFIALHRGPRAFVIANAFDAGSARALAGLGFAALATSSGAAAAVMGRRDGQLTRDEAIAHAQAIVQAVDVPVSADLENGFGATPQDAAETIRRAGADVLFAPGLPDLDAVRTVCSALTKPLNFMVGIKGKSFSVAELEAAGVRRISLATSLYRAAMRGLLDAATEVRERGTFDYLNRL